MTDEIEPPRLKDSPGTPDAVRTLLRAGSRVPPMGTSDRAAIASAVASGAGVIGGHRLLSSKAAVLGATGVGVIAVVVTAWIIATRPVDTPKPPPAGRPPIVEPVVTPTIAPPASQASPTAVSTGEATSRAPVAATDPSVRTAPSGAALDSLRRESALVQSARTLLPTDAAGALKALDEHARRFPRGQLAPERDYLRIRALSRLGRTAEAESLARAYRAKHPDSPHGENVDAFLRGAGR